MTFVAIDPDDLDVVVAEAAGRGLFSLDLRTDRMVAGARMGAVLRGAETGWDEQIATLVTAGERTRIDPITAALVGHMGVRPAALCAFAALHGGGFSLANGRAFDGEAFVDVKDSRDASASGCAVNHVRTADGLGWGGVATLRLPPLPETVAHALAGRPLRDALSHPALDAFDLRILEARRTTTTFGGRPETEIVVDAKARGLHRVMSADALMAVASAHPSAAKDAGTMTAAA